jgi:hypothetical protein
LSLWITFAVAELLHNPNPKVLQQISEHRGEFQGRLDEHILVIAQGRRAAAHRMKIAAIIRRMGFVLETLGLADEALVTKLRAGLLPGAVKLDPQLPIAGMHQAKWGLRLNVSAEEIQKAVSN